MESFAKKVSHRHKAATPKPKKAKKATTHATEPAIYRAHATLEAFDPVAYLATVQLTRSPGTTIANVPVSSAIPSANMVTGHVICVIFFDAHNSADAMIVGVL